MAIGKTCRPPSRNDKKGKTMPKREWPLRFVCSHEGCNESVTYRYETRRDLVGSYEMKNFRNGRWKCLRHSKPDRVLSSENLETRCELINEQKEHGRYFGSQGFVSGPGFLVYAADLPAGTKLIVTARIELPTPASEGEQK
jgi:hypothetical protein